MHNVGTPLTIFPGQGFVGNGSIADFVNCQGTILATNANAPSGPGGGSIGPYGNASISLTSGVMVSGTGQRQPNERHGERE